MSETPKSIYNVSIVRNMGLPKFCEGYGNGVLIVLVGVTSYQGDGKADHRGKWDRQDTSLSKLSEVCRNAAVKSSKVFKDS